MFLKGLIVGHAHPPKQDSYHYVTTWYFQASVDHIAERDYILNVPEIDSNFL